MKINKLFIWSAFALFLIASILHDIFIGGTNASFAFSVSWPSDPFPFANIEYMAPAWYIDYAVSHYILCVTVFILWRVTGDSIVWSFLLVQLFDFADYLLTYNGCYFFINDRIPVSYNTLSFLFWMFFGVKLFYQWILRRL